MQGRYVQQLSLEQTRNTDQQSRATALVLFPQIPVIDLDFAIIRASDF